MPKMKTKSGAKKRFRVRPGGTVKRGQAFKRHILTKKTTKNKRHLRGAVTVHETNMGHMAQMLPGMGMLLINCAREASGKLSPALLAPSHF